VTGVNSGMLLRWLRDYRRAWEGADPEAAAALFTADGSYRSRPLLPAHAGRDGIRNYWARVTSYQPAEAVRWGGPLIDGPRVAVEWWAALNSPDGDATVAGVLLMRFDGDLCTDLRECWNEVAGNVPPPEGWGELGGHSAPGWAAGRALQWADGYERAWRSGDAEAAAALYADDVVYRSHPFREPHVGREAVLAYTRENFGMERGQEPRFGRPLAHGSSAAVEYWTPMVEDGKEVTLVGCVVLRFREDGLVQESREYWFMEHGLHEPDEGWGE
jgi:predicted SnoaL-like aldol condensation-catalyzing enzyme